MARDSTTLPLIRARGGARRAGAGDLPRLPGTERGAGRLAAPAAAGSAGPDGPLLADGRLARGADRQGARASAITPGGWLHRLAGTTEIAVNSLHNQGVNKLAPGVRVEGVAPDGTIEAVHVLATAAGPVPGFAVGVQWHPENDWQTDIVSRRIFEDFAAAVHAYAGMAALAGVSAAAD